MKQVKVAGAVVEQLAAWQVEYVFGVCGDDLLPFLEARQLAPGHWRDWRGLAAGLAGGGGLRGNGWERLF